MKKLILISAALLVSACATMPQEYPKHGGFGDDPFELSANHATPARKAA